MRLADQAAGEYVAATGQARADTSGRTGVEGWDRALDAIATALSELVAFAMEHPLIAVMGALILVLVVERLLARRSWRF